VTSPVPGVPSVGYRVSEHVGSGTTAGCHSCDEGPLVVAVTGGWPVVAVIRGSRRSCDKKVEDNINLPLSCFCVRMAKDPTGVSSEKPLDSLPTNPVVDVWEESIDSNSSSSSNAWVSISISMLSSKL
jgi:hypothetical protein